jgi:hypothetical protein
MNQLIAQGIDAVEDDTEQFRRIAIGKCLVGAPLALREALLPFGLVYLAAVKVPKTLEDVSVGSRMIR